MMFLAWGAAAGCAKDWDWNAAASSSAQVRIVFM
jgi:hypothetical protein